MKTRAFLTILLSVLIGFIIGFISSSQITRFRTKEVRAISSKEKFKMHTFDVIKPTEEQKVKMEPIITEYSARFDSLNRTMRKSYHQLFDEYHLTLSEHLTPDQIQTLNEFTRSLRNKKKHKSDTTYNKKTPCRHSDKKKDSPEN